MTAAKDSAAGLLAGRVIRIMVYRRVFGLSAEGAFWLVFSLPWLLLGVVSIISTIDHALPVDTMAALQQRIMGEANEILSPEVAAEVVQPMVQSFFRTDAVDLTLISFVVALWSGSRGIQTFIETNMIVNGEFGRRGFIQMRLLSILILVSVAILVAVSVPLLVIGPGLLAEWLETPSWLVSLVWGGVALVLGIIILTAVLHGTLINRPSLRSSLPGAIIIVVGWWLGSYALGFYVQRVFERTSIYGVLATPIAVMVYALLLSAVGFFAATFNAALRGMDASRDRLGAESIET